MSHRNLLSRATEGTEAPTPGYLYVDLAKAATGNPGACQEMANYLTRRLASKQNPNIKFKCCKVMAKLCDQVPRNAFRRCVAQDHAGVAAIKEAMQFRGVPDPVRGDQPNQRVRDAAKEALEAVYREAPSSEQQASIGGGGAGGVPSDYGGGGGGGGHSHYSGGGGGGAYNGMPSSMQGIGNPRYPDPRNDPRYNGEQTGVKGVMKEAGEVIVGMIKDPLARNIDVPHQPRQGHSGNLPGYGAPQYGGRPPPGSAELSRNTGGEWTMASNRGPSAVQPDYRPDAAPPPQYGGGGGGGGGMSGARNGTVGGSWGSAPSSSGVIRPSQQHQSYSSTTPSVTINSRPGASSGAGGAAVSDGTYEKNLVKELCPPSGMKPVPPPDKLANFARACASLNSDLVCPVLLDCLEEGQPWIIRAKALCAMETSIGNGAKPDGQNHYRDFFYACRDEIAPLASHPRTAIHEPARRVLTLLGVSAGAAATTAAAAAAAPAAPAPNLLDFDDAPPPPPPPTEAPPPAPPAAAPAAPGGGGGSMFGGMQVKNSPAPPARAPVPAAAAAAPSLLDFDTPDPAPAAAAPAANDVFSADEKKAATEPSAVAATSSMFDQLSVKAASPTAAATSDAASAALAAPAGSAFGFINSDAGPEAAAANGQPPSFDPLKNANFSPSAGANKKAMSMQMSPEQMQAMAYQQMMMQQQMQHMQMAMSMQNGAVPMFPNIVGPGNPPQRMPSGGSMGGAGGGGGGVRPQQFSFNNATKPAQKDDKKFDFVMDAMKTAKK